MVDKLEDLYGELMMLSEEERSRLRELLEQTRAGDFASPETGKAWLEEIERREKEYADGKMELIPAEDVFRELRKIVGE